MNNGKTTLSIDARTLGLFVVLQLAVMALAVSAQSLWIDEFWTAHFATLSSLQDLISLVLVPSGSQTPLHFGHYYLWGRFFEPTELALRLANLPLFLLGQLSMLLALRGYPKVFACFALTLCAMHPMVWQYANEARPYIMIYAGSQMVLAYLLHLHSRFEQGLAPTRAFTAIFVVGSILLFGASLLGVFWVFAACAYAALLHHRCRQVRHLLHGATLGMLVVLALVVLLLSVYYVSSLLKGAGGARLAPSTPATVLFAAYELLGLSGLGPGRQQLREIGLAVLAPYAIVLGVGASVVLFTLALGVQSALARLGTQRFLIVAMLALFPVAVVLAAGFIMHWRVLGRHLFATIPILNLVLALGLAKLWVAPAGRERHWQRWIAVACVLVLTASALSIRFADRHLKDEYRLAAAIATEHLDRGQRVWWAAGYLGAHYYRLPGKFDYMGELTSVAQPADCMDLPGVQATANLEAECLRGLSAPDLVIFSRPETFDKTGAMRAYLKAAGFVQVREFSAFTLWQRGAGAVSTGN